MKIQTIKLKDIEQNENSRVVYKTGELVDLMASMKKDGLLQPIGVRKLAHGKFDAVFGNRRIAAARKLGWEEIAAHVMDLDTDTDRDIVNLIENIKRQNTTVAEDGRMFQILVDRGLTPAEVAARLGVGVARVETALDVVSSVPKEYHKSIVNRSIGDRKVAGAISASAAHEILSIRRANSLTKNQTKKLLDFAKRDETNLAQVRHIAPLVKEGLSVERAIKVASNLVRFNMTIYADKRTVETLENKTGKTYMDLLWEQLEESKELGVERKLGGDRYYATDTHRSAKMKVIARHSAE